MRKRTKILAGISAATLLALLLVGVHEHSARQWATLRAVEVAPLQNGCKVSLNIDGACGYEISRSGARTVRVGLEGARVDRLLQLAQHAADGLFQGYRISTLKPANGSPEVQIQIETRSPVHFSLQNEGSSLGLVMKPVVTIATLPLDRSVTTNALALLAPRTRWAASWRSVGRPTNLSGVSIRRVTANQTFVNLNTSGPAQFRTIRLNNPPRLVIDLENTGISTAQEVYTASGALVKEVRVAEHNSNFTKVARVVADLAGDPSVRIHSALTGLEVELTATEPEPAAVAASAASVAQARSEYEKQTLARLMQPVKVSLDMGEAPQPAKVAETKAQNPVLQPLARKTKPLVPRPTKVQASQPRLAEAPLEFADTLPLRQDWANVDSAPYLDTPSMLPTALAAMKAAQVVAGQGTPKVFQFGGKVAQPGAKTQAPNPYTGELISVNLKDVDLKDFFRLIHEISGLNVVVDSDVKGTVTLVLDDVPWDEALDIVLKNNGLGKQLEGNVLRIAKISTLTAEEQNTVDLRKAQELAAPLVEIYRPLKYAQAIDTRSVTQVQGFTQPLAIPGVVTILKSFAPGSVLSARGSVVADPRNNAVIVTDIPTQIPVIEAMIGKLDRKPKQISIEARIVQANADFSRQLSSVLATAFKNESTGTSAATGTNILSIAPPQAPLPGLTAALQPLSVGNTGFGAFAITNAGARYAISAALSAAETRDQAKIISRPTIVTQNNVAASVQQGVQIPIQTSINNTVTVQFVNATLQLSVIPQVTQNGQIFLNIVVNNASVGAVLSFAGPSINTQQATTQVLVPDGGTVVFGGITVTNRNRNATYVPLLGSIPIIGNLFKSSTVNTTDQELLFFVSPKILPDNS